MNVGYYRLAWQPSGDGMESQWIFLRILLFQFVWRCPLKVSGSIGKKGHVNASKISKVLSLKNGSCRSHVVCNVTAAGNRVFMPALPAMKIAKMVIAVFHYRQSRLPCLTASIIAAPVCSYSGRARTRQFFCMNTRRQQRSSTVPLMAKLRRLSGGTGSFSPGFGK